MGYVNTPPASPDDHFTALADPTRRRIIAMLVERDRTVNEIAEEFDISRPAISKHLRVLRHAGLVREEKRGRERIQRFNGAALKPVADWINKYESFWEQKLAGLKRLVEEEQ
jgi:DNA-binding transcriptional ArsR family regulator